MEQLQFRKSSYSVGNPEQCAEVAFASDGVHVRDSKAPRASVLKFGAAGWAAFVAARQNAL